MSCDFLNAVYLDPCRVFIVIWTSTSSTPPCRSLMSVTGPTPGWPSWSRCSSPSASPCPSWWWDPPWSIPVSSAATTEAPDISAVSRRDSSVTADRLGLLWAAKCFAGFGSDSVFPFFQSMVWWALCGAAACSGWLKPGRETHQANTSAAPPGGKTGRLVWWRFEMMIAESPCSI